MNAYPYRAKQYGLCTSTIAALFAVQVHAQNVARGSCPESECVRQICLTDLPDVEWILTYSATEGYRQCACPPVPASPGGGTVDLLMRRKNLYLANWNYFSQNLVTDASTEQCTAGYRLLVSFEGATREGGTLCTLDTLLLGMFRTIQSWGLTPQLQLAIHDVPCGMHFPRFVAMGQGLEEELPDSLPDRLQLTFPRRLLDDNNTGKELLLFLLLHEIGHGVRGTFNSLLADDWAARVGPALYYKEQWTPEFARGFLEKVGSQLLAYMGSQELPEFFGRASPMSDGGEEYPSIASRLYNIRGGYLAPLDGGCNSYEETAFTNRLEEGTRVLGNSYVARRCYPQPVSPEMEVPERVMLKALQDMCDRYPFLCNRPGIERGRVKRGIRVNASQLLDALQREVGRSQHSNSTPEEK